MATVKYTFNPFELVGRDPPETGKRALLQEIRDFVIEKTLETVASQKSPVTGKKFRSLSPDYRAFKVKKRRPGVPNLEFSGAMLDALGGKVSGETITIQITGKQGDKADGHNNHSGKSKLPKRTFIPNSKKDETYSKSIMRGIREILDGS